MDGNDEIGSDDESDSSVMVGDEYFMRSFTLSKFRSDLMKLAVEHFPREYGSSKKALRIGSMLFFQLEWNKSTWWDIATTDSLLYNITDQMETKIE